MKTTFFLSIALICTLFSEENFILINSTGEVLQEWGPHIDQRVTPCSTFKIALSLIGFDRGNLKDESTPVYQYQTGYDDFLPIWKNDQTPRSWMQHSCIWYSKLLTQELGMETLQDYLRSFDYGNQDMSGGITKAWLSSTLAISPREQVGFIQKMITGKLPVSYHSLEMTKKLLFHGEWGNGKLYGKTGMSSLSAKTGLREGWFVGWLENDNETLIFAYNIRAPKIDPALRIPRVKELLYESGIEIGLSK